MTSASLTPTAETAGADRLPTAPAATGPVAGTTLILDPGSNLEKGSVTLIDSSGSVSRFVLGGDFRDSIEFVHRLVEVKRVARILVDGNGYGWAVFESLQKTYFARRDVTVTTLTVQPASVAFA